MKIEDWERKDYSKRHVEWTHISGVKIILKNEAYNLYSLKLYDSSGIEHFATDNSNRSKLEAESVKWQRKYNKHLNKKPKQKKRGFF